MARRVFDVELSQKGIEQLKKDLRNYRDNILQNNIREYVRRLLELGVQVSQASVNESPLGKYITLTTNISSTKMGCSGILLAKGEIKQEQGPDGKSYPPFSTILAIEFGAGIHFNPLPNPNASNLGFGVGTFPGQLHAFDDVWFYWEEDEQQWKPTHGVKATMPMYNALNEMISNAVKIAKGVF